MSGGSRKRRVPIDAGGVQDWNATSYTHLLAAEGLSGSIMEGLSWLTGLDLVGHLTAAFRSQLIPGPHRPWTRPMAMNFKVFRLQIRIPLSTPPTR